MIPEGKRIYVADEHPVIHAGLVRLIEDQPGWRLVGGARSCAEAWRSVMGMPVDLLILEPAMGGMDGLTRLGDFAARTRVLCFSMLPEVCLAERVLREGARGYLMKWSTPDEIRDAIRAVLAGDIVLSPEARRRVLERAAGVARGDPADDLGALSNRELQIVHLIGVNRSSRQIAEHMRLSEKTVATHRLRIREKLALRRPSDLLRTAARWVEHDALP